MDRRVPFVALVWLAVLVAGCGSDSASTQSATPESAVLTTTVTVESSISTTTVTSPPTTTSTPATTTIDTIDPATAVSAFEFPEMLGSFTVMPAEGGEPIDEWEFVKDDPTCAPFEAIIQKTAAHSEASYVGATPLEVRLVDVGGVGEEEATAALAALADGAAYTACAVKVSKGALPILPPDFALSSQGEGSLPARDGQTSRWLRTDLSIPSFGVSMRNDLIFLSAGPLVVSASLSGVVDDAEVVAIASDLSDRLDAAVSG